MTNEEIVAKLTPIVREVLGNAELVITEDMTPATVQEWTSLNQMMLLTEIENQFGFKFKLMDTMKMKCMGDIINTISKRL